MWWYTTQTYVTRKLRDFADWLEPQRTTLMRRQFRTFESVLVYVLCKFRVADSIADRGGYASLNELVVDTGIDEHRLYRLMRAAVVHGYFQDVTDVRNTMKRRSNTVGNTDRISYHRYANTALSSLLREKHRFSARSSVLHLTGDMLRVWQSLDTALLDAKNERTAFDLSPLGATASANDFFDYMFRVNSQSGDHLMSYVDSLQFPRALAREFDFGMHCASVVDIGGGVGVFAQALADEYPQLSEIVVYDLPNVVASSVEGTDRISFVGGSFLDTISNNNIPMSHSCYVARMVFHDWDDASARVIATNIGAAMSKHSRLFIIEVITASDDAEVDEMRSILDIHTMTYGGKERTLEEFKRMLPSRTRVAHVHKTRGPLHMLEVVKY